MKTITEQIEACRVGKHPRLVAPMPSGWLVLAPSQRLPGYCILLADPIVTSLNDLDPAPRAQFLADMTRAGDAIASVRKPRRLNYEILGNLDPTLHAHVAPRYEDEPESMRAKPIFQYPPEDWDAPAHAFSEDKHGALRKDIARAMRKMDDARPLAPAWQNAAGFAARMHLGQTRKDGVTPYVSHPFRVAMTVRDVFGCADETALAAALLHDVIEDTPADYDEVADDFGHEVARIVAALTKDMRLPEPQREPAYDDGLRAADWRAHLIKLADQYDNLGNAMAEDRKLAKFLEKCGRAIEVCGANPPAPVRRAIDELRRLMAEAEGKRGKA